MKVRPFEGVDCRTARNGLVRLQVHRSLASATSSQLKIEHSTAATEEAILTALGDLPLPFPSGKAVGAAMQKLIEAGLCDLPLPGSGQTLARWQALAAVAAIDLSLAKMYEGHTDALAIVAELGGGQCSAGLWAVWASEPPSARLSFRVKDGGGILEGRKAWCSGAANVEQAVVSAWNERGQPVLARVSLHQPGVTIEAGGWEAVGMAASESVSVSFDGAEAIQLGRAGDYVSRPGFWQGGAGIAAVWYGGAAAIARELASSPRVKTDTHAAAHLGAVDAALRATKALLVETAGWIDEHPTDDACAAALRVRACADWAANEVLLRVGRALGAAPLCLHAVHARRCADLPVFLRQNHAEADLAALGQDLGSDSSAWQL